MERYEKPIAELIDFQPVESIMLGGTEGSDLEDWAFEDEGWE